MGNTRRGPSRKSRSHGRARRGRRRAPRAGTLFSWELRSCSRARGPPPVTDGGPGFVVDQRQPAANADWKQMKSFTFRIGSVVLPSQLAYESPAANADWKQMKSLTFRIGSVVLPSQLG